MSTFIAVGDGDFGSGFELAVIRSVDSGVNWVDVRPSGHVDSTGNWVDGDGFGNWLIAAYQAIWVSEDDGIGWAQVTPPLAATTWDYCCCVGERSFLVIAATGSVDRVWKTTDLGASWTEVTPGGASGLLNAAWDGDQTVVMIYEDGTAALTGWLSVDAGDTWTALSEANGAYSNPYKISFAGGQFIVGLVAPGIMYSTTGAVASWTFKSHSGLYTGSTGLYAFVDNYWFGNAEGEQTQTRVAALADDVTLPSAPEERQFTSLASDGTTAVFVFNNAYAAPIYTGVYNTSGTIELSSQVPPSTQNTATYYSIATATVAPDPAGTLYYGLWQHEIGVNEVDGNTVNAVYSYFRTGNLTLLNNGVDKNIQIERVEPDFVQVGDMVMRVVGRNNARAATTVSEALPMAEDTQLIYPKNTRRFLQLQFESNTTDGYYLMGTPVLHLRDSDGRSST